MSFSQNFSSSQSISTPSIITLVDTSTGTDNSLTNRMVTVTLSDGTTLVPAGTTSSFFNWPYSDGSITVNLLDKSTVANVLVVWLSGSTANYSKEILMEWNLYDYLFLFELLQTQTSDPDILSDANYYSNFLKMIVNLFNASNAVTYMSDIYSAQGALDKNKYMMD